MDIHFEAQAELHRHGSASWKYESKYIPPHKPNDARVIPKNFLSQRVAEALESPSLYANYTNSSLQDPTRPFSIYSQRTAAGLYADKKHPLPSLLDSLSIFSEDTPESDTSTRHNYSPSAQNTPLVIIKSLPRPDLTVKDIELLVQQQFVSRNRVVAAQEQQSGSEVVVKTYADATRAAREITVLLHLQQTPFRTYLPEVFFFQEGVLLTIRERAKATSLLERARILAHLHELAGREISLANFPPVKGGADEEMYETIQRVQRKRDLPYSREIVARLHDAQQILAEAPKTGIHGDPKPENWVGKKLIDWESASVGAREKDLARLLLHPEVSEEDAQRTLLAYQKEANVLRDADFDVTAFAQLQELFRAARLVEALRKLGTNVQKAVVDGRKIEYLQKVCRD